MTKNHVIKPSSKYRDSSDFCLKVDYFGNELFASSNLGISLKIKKGGYVPKSGLLLVEALDSKIIKGKVLDIGTGETGFIAHYLSCAGAEEMIGSDINNDAINHAKITSPRKTNIKWLKSDVYENIPRTQFNLIVSNPPQMPCGSNGNHHDCGGLNGREIIERIIYGATEYLYPNGKLIILCFDFLGIEKRFNNQESIMEIAEELNLKTKILKRFIRTIRKGGKTEQNLDWIKKVYPKYEFRQRKNNLQHEILILELTKKQQLN